MLFKLQIQHLFHVLQKNLTPIWSDKFLHGCRERVDVMDVFACSDTFAEVRSVDDEFKGFEKMQGGGVKFVLVEDAVGGVIHESR